MHRVDITQKAYSKKLADLTDQRSQIVRKIQDRSTWAAAKSAEYRDIVNNDNFCEENSPLREQARLMSGEVEMRFREILEWENELMAEKGDHFDRGTSEMGRGESFETPPSSMRNKR